MKRMRDKKGLCLALTVLAIFLAAVVSIFAQEYSSSPGKAAAIYQDGKLLRRIPLTEGTEETFAIESSDGGYNTIRITEGKIGIIEADCPDRLCVKMGMVSSTGRPISCLPHRLVIQIEDEKEESPVDATTR